MCFLIPKASLFVCASLIGIAKPWKSVKRMKIRDNNPSTKEGSSKKQRRKIERSALFTKPRQQVYPPFRSEGDAEKMHVQEVDLSKSDLGMQIFFLGRKDHVIGRWTCYLAVQDWWSPSRRKDECHRVSRKLDVKEEASGSNETDFPIQQGEKIIWLQLIIWILWCVENYC